MEEEVMVKCKKCGSEHVVKNDVVGGRQRYRCGDCSRNYREGDVRTNEKAAAKKALCILPYAMAKRSFRRMGKILSVNHALAHRWIRAYGESLSEPEVSGAIQEMEFNEMWHLLVQKALGHQGPGSPHTENVVWLPGGRDARTFRRLYDNGNTRHPFGRFVRRTGLS
jgi:transposase